MDGSVLKGSQVFANRLSIDEVNTPTRFDKGAEITNSPSNMQVPP